MSQLDPAHAQLIRLYRKKAKHYDLTSRLYPAPGYPQRSQRQYAVEALRLRPGATVVDIACGTGLNFALLQQAIGPSGRIIGVDVTDAMLARAHHRIATKGWTNVSLVNEDAAEFAFPDCVDAILSTYAMSQVPRCAEVIANGAAALAAGGRWSVLDLKLPGRTPAWVKQIGTAVVRPFASIDDWIGRKPWDVIHDAMLDDLVDVSWRELFFGSAFLATGARGQSPRGR